MSHPLDQREIAELTAQIAVLRAKLAEATADAEQMRLVLAAHGQGVDPNGYYAGTPGWRLRRVMTVVEAAKAADDAWRSTGTGVRMAVPLANLSAAVAALAAAEQSGADPTPVAASDPTADEDGAGVEATGDARCNHLFEHADLGTVQCVQRRRHVGPHDNGSITWTMTDHREPDSRAGQTGEEEAGG